MSRFINASTLVWFATSLFVALIILVPIYYLLSSSFGGMHGNFDNYIRVLSSPGTISSVVNTLIYVLGVAVLSVLIGVPLAFLVERININPVAAQALRLSIIASIIVPGFLMAMAYVNLLGPNAGTINLLLRDVLSLDITRGPLDVFSIWGVLLLGTQSAVAFVFLVTSASLAKMNPELEEAAAIAGESNLGTVARITLPLVRNAIYAGALVSLASALTDYGIPHMLGFTVLTLRIREYMLTGDFAGAAAVSVLVVLFALLVLAVYRKSTGKGNFAIVSGKGFHPRKFDIGLWSWPLNVFAYFYVFITVLLPVYGLISVSLLQRLGDGVSLDNLTLNHYYNVLLRDNFALNAFTNSLLLSTATAVTAALLALVIGYLVVRKRNVLTAALDYLSVMPLGIAGTALAVAIIMTVTNPPFAALSLYGTLWVLFIAYFIRNFPLAIRPIQTTLSQISTELEEAAYLSGASWLHTLRTILAPLVGPGIIAGAILVFLGSLTEVSASIILRHIGTDTIATAILDIWDGGGGYQQASAFAVCIFVVMVLIAVIPQFLMRKASANND